METLHSMWIFLLFLISIISGIGICILYISQHYHLSGWTCVLHVDVLLQIGHLKAKLELNQQPLYLDLKAGIHYTSFKI